MNKFFNSSNLNHSEVKEPDEIYDILKEALSRVGGSALAFSGGIDSTLLMHVSGYSLNPYTVHTGITRDYENSTVASKMLGFGVNFIDCNIKDVKEASDLVREIDPEIPLQDLGYETVLMIILNRAEEKYIVTGQGADELFYGYKKYFSNDHDNSADLEKLFTITLPREKKMAAKMGKAIITPYLDPEIIQICSAMKRERFIEGNENKIVLREVARIAGLPDQLCNTRKKAAQYGSGIQKIIRSLYSS